MTSASDHPFLTTLTELGVAFIPVTAVNKNSVLTRNVNISFSQLCPSFNDFRRRVFLSFILLLPHPQTSITPEPYPGVLGPVRVRKLLSSGDTLEF